MGNGGLCFGPFRLDVAGQRLRRDEEALALTPKSFSVLCHLISHRDRLVTKEELLDALWKDTHVGDGVLKVAIAELRRVLDDGARSPLYIETVQRRGYHFVASIEPAETGRSQIGASAAIIGRQSEL